MAKDKGTLKAYLEYQRDARVQKYKTKGIVVAFDGMPGSGKDFQIDKLEGALRKEGARANTFRETSLVKSDERIAYMEDVRRTGIENPDKSAQLYTEDRIKAWETYIIPAMKEDGLVLLDRCGYSTLLIQALTRNINLNNQKELTSLAEELFPEPIIPPHVSFFTICTPEIAYERAKERYENSRGELTDYFDEVYISHYRMTHSDETASKEKMRMWWLETNKEMYRGLKRAIPNSHLVTTGRKTDKVNPVIYEITKKLNDNK